MTVKEINNAYLHHNLLPLHGRCPILGKKTYKNNYE